MFTRFAALLLIAGALAAADVAFTGTWAVGGKPAIASDATTVVATFNLNAACCGGPAAALAGLAGLRDALKEQKNVVLVAVDQTPGATKESSAAAAAKHKLDGIPVLTDDKNTTGNALGAEVENSISYVVIKPDGTKKVLGTPNSVKKFLKG